MAKPIALIFGVGPGIGLTTARHFVTNGYRVASATRTAKQPDDDNNLFIPCDVRDPETISKAFEKVRSTWSSDPSVIIYNAYAARWGTGSSPFESITTSEFASDLTGNVVSAYVAIQESLKGFKKLPEEVKKRFMLTGNLLNEMKPLEGAPMLSLGVGKSASSFMISQADLIYKKDFGYRFFYVDERSSSGGPPPRANYEPDAQGHADVFLELAKGKEDAPWQFTFVSGEGYKKFSKD